MRDSLTLDQANFEIVYDPIQHVPESWVSVDANHIRYVNESIFSRLNESERRSFKRNGEYPKYVFEYEDQAIIPFWRHEMCMGIRNPTTSIVYPYGRAEIDRLSPYIKSLINTDIYIENFFIQGSMPRGMLFLPDAGPDRLQEFADKWRQDAQGVDNAHRIPIYSFNATQGEKPIFQSLETTLVMQNGINGESG